MKFQISCRLFILLVIIINLFGLSKQDEHSANVSLCKFDIMNVDEVKRTFEDFNSMDNVWLIYFDLTLQPATFIDETKFDDKQINGLTRWTWVPRKHSYLLTYPVDLAAITFRISRNVEKQIAVSVNASFMFDKMNLQNYSMCIESLYATILENILNGNKIDWLFCNRYFEGQDYKTVLYELTGSWLGYNFACFDSIHHKVTSATFIKTGTVNIVINIFIFLLCLYFPLLFLLMPDRFNIDRDDARFYRKGEYPYSFARIILRMHDTHIQETAEISSVEEWLDQFDIKQYKPEIHVFSFLYIVTLVMYILENNFIKQVIPDYTYFPDIFRSWQSSNGLFFNVGFLSISYFITIPFFIIAMSYSSQSINTYLSVNPLGLIRISDVWNTVEPRGGQYVGYTKFAKKFFHRTSFFFSLELWATSFTFPFTDNGHLSYFCNTVIVSLAFFANLFLYFLFLLVPITYFICDCFILFPFKLISVWCRTRPRENKILIGSFCQLVISGGYAVFFFRSYFLFVVQFIFRSIVYVIFVAGPLFVTVSDTLYSFWAVILSVVIYLVKYKSSFHTNYKKLLDLLFKIEKDWQSQRERGRDVNAEGQIERINVHDFDRIAEKYLPFRNQIFYLILKITLTSLFLYVTFDSINQGENNKFTIAFLPTIITVALPELAEKLFSPFNIEETLKLHEDEIKSDFLEGLNNAIPNTIVSNIQADNRMERIMLVFPVVYSVFVFCCFICNTICLRPSSFNTRPCPTTCTVCCIRINENNDHDENDEPHVMIPLRSYETNNI